MPPCQLVTGDCWGGVEERAHSPKASSLRSQLAAKTHSSWAMGPLSAPAERDLGRAPSALQDSVPGTVGAKRWK